MHPRQGDAWNDFAGHAGPLKDYAESFGQTFTLARALPQAAAFRTQARAQLRVEDTASTWLLAPNLPGRARSIIDFYYRRFRCDEASRNQKQAFELEAMRVTSVERLDDRLQAPAIVFFILAVIGVCAEQLGPAYRFATRTKGRKVLSWCHLAVD